MLENLQALCREFLLHLLMQKFDAIDLKVFILEIAIYYLTLQHMISIYHHHLRKLLDKITLVVYVESASSKKINVTT